MKNGIFLFITLSILGLSSSVMGQGNYEEFNVYKISFFADSQQLDSCYVSLSSIREASREGSGWYIERASGRNRGGPRIARNEEIGVLFFFWNPIGKKVPITNLMKDEKQIPKNEIVEILRGIATK